MSKPNRGQATSSDTLKDLDLCGGDDDWVIVKKQRVNILIPPLPEPAKLTIAKPRPTNPERLPSEALRTKSVVPMETCVRMPLVVDRERVTPSALVLNRGAKMNKETPTPLLKGSGLVKRIGPSVAVKSGNFADRLNAGNLLGLCNVSKAIKRPRLLHVPTTDTRTVLNQRLRASLLEKKLQRAGGLSRWLASLGLGQFVRIFQGKCVSKFQLVNLTMKKLKDMGADAVGPRRKLMHAIDCICQPYCFETAQ